MKGMSEGLMILVGIILSIIMLVIFFEITSYASEKSNERAAVSSISELSRNINDVCNSMTPGYYKEMTISLPQNGVDYPKILKPILKMSIGTFQISHKGDPDFLIYYDSFPQLEDLAWLLNVRRNVYPFYINYTSDGTVDASGYKKIFPTFLYNETLGYKLIFNVIPSNSTEGKWNSKYPYIYVYNTSSFDINVKLMRKYQMCGNYSLCLKTNDMLYTYKLNCKKPIPIELERGTANGASWLKKMWEQKSLSISIGNTSTSFYMASPCKIKVRIQKGKCKFYRNLTIPVYNSTGNLIGYHTIYQKAWEKVLVNKTIGKQYLNGVITQDLDDKEVDCIQIIPISNPYGFCYASPNLPAGLIFGTYHIAGAISGNLWFIGYKKLEINEERSEIENYILQHGLGKIRQYFFTWPDHPLN